MTLYESYHKLSNYWNTDQLNSVLTGQPLCFIGTIKNCLREKSMLTPHSVSAGQTVGLIPQAGIKGMLHKSC